MKDILDFGFSILDWRKQQFQLPFRFRQFYSANPKSKIENPK